MLLSPSDQDDFVKTLWILAISTVLVVLVASIDFFTHSFNISIVYALPLAIMVHMRYRIPWPAAIILVFVTYAGYLLGPWPAKYHSLHEMVTSYGMFNRSIVAAVIVTLTLLASAMRTFAPHLQGATTAAASESPYLSFYRLLCPLAILGVALVDLITPANFNLPILYIIPVLFCPLSFRRPVMLWVVVAFIICFAVAGFAWGPPALGNVQPANLIMNRTISMVVVLGIAVALQIWTSFSRKARSDAASLSEVV